MNNIPLPANARGEQIYQPLYDSTIIEGGPFRHEFHCCPIGQRNKTCEDTNMVIGNMLPLRNYFYMTGIGIYVVPDINGDLKNANRREQMTDMLYMLGHGYARLVVGMRKYLELAPLAAAPPQFPMYWARDDKTLEKLFESGPKKAVGPGVKVQKPFEMVPLFINSQQWFAVDISMDNHFKLNSPCKLAVMLDGYLIRNDV
jgi:hypothetical protein